jgi:hypothetical protein
MVDFVNLKIKSAQSFKYAYMSRVHVRIFIGESAYTYMTIYVCFMFVKKSENLFSCAHVQCLAAVQLGKGRLKL